MGSESRLALDCRTSHHLCRSNIFIVLLSIAQTMMFVESIVVKNKSQFTGLTLSGSVPIGLSSFLRRALNLML